MARYVTEMNRTASTTLSVGSVNAAAASQRRLVCWRLLRFRATPADNAFLCRHSAARLPEPAFNDPLLLTLLMLLLFRRQLRTTLLTPPSRLVPFC